MNRWLWIGIALVALVIALALRVEDAKDPDAGPGGSAGAAPTRILPGSAAAADWVAALVEPGRVVALPATIVDYSVVREDSATWGGLPTFADFTSEAILGYRPDLVLVSPWTDATAVRRIEEAGLAVVRVTEPAGWDELVEVGRAVAAAAHATDAGEAFIADLERRRAALVARRPPEPPRILPYSNGGSGGFTMGAGTTLDLALELAGCVNVAAEAGIEGASSLTDEEILALDFDAFLVAGEDGVSATAEILRAKSALATVPAVREARFIRLEPALYSSGSYTILDAAEIIADGPSGPDAGR